MNGDDQAAQLCVLLSPDLDTNRWTEVVLPQLSAPRAGHSIIAMEKAGHIHFNKEQDEMDTGRVPSGKTLLVFGGGDNEGQFYSDLTTVAVEDLLVAL